MTTTLLVLSTRFMSLHSSKLSVCDEPVRTQMLPLSNTTATCGSVGWNSHFFRISRSRSRITFLPATWSSIHLNLIKINKNLLNNTRHSTNIFLFFLKKCQHWAAPEIVAMATVCVRLRPIQWQPIRLSASDTDLVINVMAWSNQPWRHHFNPLSSINLGNILAIE